VSFVKSTIEPINQTIIHLTGDPVGRGRERSCYVHPDDPSKLIKISGPESSTQTRRDVDFYMGYDKRVHREYTQLPRFYGMAQTSLGNGMLVDYICDHDGSASKSLREYLNEGHPLTYFEPYLDQLKDFLLRNQVIFNHDMVTRNILFQKFSTTSSRLVLIDGIGDVVSIQWLNRFPFHARAKINRRWDRFLEKLYTRHSSN
jgi:hypothetical protein